MGMSKPLRERMGKWLQASTATLVLCVCSTAYAQAEGTACPVTVLGGDGLYGDEYIAVNLQQMASGVLGPPLIWMADRSLRVKLGWRRGVRGTPLTIEGRRLDEDAPPLRAWIPAHTGEIGGQTAVLFFPTPGCWQVTGRLGEHALTFVVLVPVKDG